MSWTEIKGALNGTIGTDRFQTLDQLILGAKGLVASDNFYSSVLSERVVVNYGGSHDITLKMKWSGTLKFRYSSESYGTQGNGATFSVYVNDVLKFSESDEDGAFETNIISFSQGDEIKISYSVKEGYESAWGAISKIDIYADITDLSAYDII